MTRRTALVLLVTLALSNGARLLWPAKPEPGDDLETVPVVRPSGEAVRLALRRHEGGSGRPVVLLHGSPGSHRDFSLLAPVLSRDRPVLVPDLAGFGASSRMVDDYSFVAHAEDVLRLLDRLGIGEPVHLVGFSMGGGVALSLADLAPGRTASVTLLSAIGVQELELLGQYHLNHVVHGFQLGGLRLALLLLPHFGLLDRQPLSIPYARNFYDSDQRPLRGILKRLAAPTLVIHGESDPLVPLAAALEHHRLVPQSELVVLATDHFYLFRDPQPAARELVRFLEAVDEGRARPRSGAAPERLARSALPFDPSALPPLAGMGLVVLLGLLAVSTFLSEDLTCIAAGVLVAQGRLAFGPAAGACFVGILVGDVGLYLVGWSLGRAVLARPPFSWWVSSTALERSADWFDRRGVWVVFASRFTPGTRLATYLAAGILGAGLVRFTLVLGLAAGLWTPALVGFAVVFGAAVQAWAGGLGIAILTVLGLVLGLRAALRLATRNGRRRAWGRWLRWRHWEFWPPWLFYPPVIAWILLLGLRYRSLTLWTAANPGIPLGGFIGERKREILEALRQPAGSLLPRWRLLRGGAPLAARCTAAAELAEEVSYPLVLKPDVGQRASGVVVVAGPEDVETYLARTRVDTIAQAYVPGVEAGLFYVRRPSEARGRILSCTEKHLPDVVGDGRSTFEELVLADERAVALADLYLARADDPTRVVPAGEGARLTEVGAHCRGAVFRDGRERITPELEAVVERVAQGTEGFFFGRFDVRSPSWEALQRGDLRIIELNGVTSEATHMYDRRYGVLAAWRTAAGIWSLAFEIGAENRRRGVRPASLGDLVRALRSYRAELGLRPD